MNFEGVTTPACDASRVMYHSLDDPDRYLEGRTRTVESVTVIRTCTTKLSVGTLMYVVLKLCWFARSKSR